MAAIREVFLSCIDPLRALIAAPEVAERWGRPSALPRMSTGGLAAHLARAVLTVDTYLDAPVSDADEPVGAIEYWQPEVGSDQWADMESAVNTGIRERAEALGAEGRDAVLAALDAASSRLRDRLPDESRTRVLTVRSGLVMRLDEYLATRMIEITVHADDLAVSAGLPSPDLPSESRTIAIDQLVSLARAVHGDWAVLRALARRERDEVNALRVF